VFIFVILLFCGYLYNILTEAQGNTEDTIVPKLRLDKKEITEQLLFAEECVICLDLYEKKDKITKLECEHIFHHECIVIWTKNNNSCPLCRIQLL